MILIRVDLNERITVTLTLEHSDVLRQAETAKQIAHNRQVILDKLGRVSVALDAIEALGEGLSLVRSFTHSSHMRVLMSMHRFTRQPKWSPWVSRPSLKYEAYTHDDSLCR